MKFYYRGFKVGDKLIPTRSYSKRATRVIKAVGDKTYAIRRIDAHGWETGEITTVEKLFAEGAYYLE